MLLTKTRSDSVSMLYDGNKTKMPFFSGAGIRRAPVTLARTRVIIIEPSNMQADGAL